MNNENCTTAIIEFGDCDKEGYVFIKGGLNPDVELLAHTYWYPDDITNEEAECEVNDLLEQYENVAIVLPILDHLHLEVLKHE